ncbi:histone-lysine N-methyltransferase EHMT2 isoform X1 [Histomonas meleagridis]|uniref:histone-lysine N-methyltransferase EHMT2 isoform X1 n=1 Tax=Histomonas meleagridis TaxID=135588 RepID=UPI00355A9303|nr:histone-lysine N-methyltransferase EHMT2 isoform X1 [Histomonas meleagridis]KAH0804887.1 histone-lysine N-methyltransferase EHMT2 isoform X1 [Histomonas meleagridis]
MEMRKMAGDSKTHPRTKRLVLLYQCLQFCDESSLLTTICAISFITGLSPSIIADHNILDIDPSHLVILEAMHHKANKKINGPTYSYSGRVEVHKVTEALPPTFLWTLKSNSYSDIQIPSFFTSVNLPKPNIEPLLANQFPPNLTAQQQWILFSPAQRKLLPKPFFYTPDLSDGFNVKHGIPPVPCFNPIDDQRPPLIQWIANLETPESIPRTYYQCHCQSHHCLDCHVLTFPDGLKTMKYNENGRIDWSTLNKCKPIIIECTEQCQCNKMKCKNRVVQNKQTVRLAVVRSLSKSGWGVRSLDFIPSGTFVCEYLGEVISDPLMAEVIGIEYDSNLESYLFDLDAYDVPAREMLTVDPSKIGNIAKYINHSCDPNLIQISIGTVNSKRFHRIAFFALKDIYPNEELGFHYNYNFDMNPSRFIECNCGALNCRTRLR